MKLLYHGRMWQGGTALQKFEAFRRQPGVTAIAHDAGTLSAPFNLLASVRWKLRWPSDQDRENDRLIEAVASREARCRICRQQLLHCARHPSQTARDMRSAARLSFARRYNRLAQSDLACPADISGMGSLLHHQNVRRFGIARLWRARSSVGRQRF